MFKKCKRGMTVLLAAVMLLTTMLPLTASAASGVTMDLTDCHVSWDYTLTDEEGKISLFCDGKFIGVISQKDAVFIKKADFQAEFVAGQNNFFDKLLFKLNKWSN